MGAASILLYVAFSLVMVLYLGGVGYTLAPDIRKVFSGSNSYEGNKTDIIADILCYLSLLMVILAAFYWLSTLVHKSSGCSHMTDSLDGHLVSLNMDTAAGITLKEYYIKSAYNACASGDYKGDYVDMCALTYSLKQGYRMLDFEIANVGGQPVVVVSSTASAKESYNYLLWTDVLTHIKTNAFSASMAPNFADPIILHLRVQSNDVTIYNAMAKSFEQLPATMVLGSQYSFENGGHNLGNALMTNLSKKIIIIVDRSNATYLESKSFCEYVNGASGTNFIRLLRYSDIKNSSDMTELTEFNRTGLTIVIPDYGTNPANPNSNQTRNAGVQMTAMRLKPSVSNDADDFYDQRVAGIVIKPAKLRPVVVQVAVAAPDPTVSYEPKTVSGPMWSLPV